MQKSELTLVQSGGKVRFATAQKVLRGAECEKYVESKREVREEDKKGS